jgi:hypothetical protein
MNVKPLRPGERIFLGVVKIAGIAVIAALFVASGLPVGAALLITVVCLFKF